MRADTTIGRLVKVGLTNDDNGREVLRAIVDFHNGNAPEISFGAIFNALPVRIVLDNQSEGSDMLYAAYNALLFVLGYGVEVPSKAFHGPEWAKSE